MVIRIESADDPRVADYRDIKERDLVGRRGRFVAEGAVVVERLAGSATCRPVSLFVSENRLARMATTIEALGTRCPVYTAPAGVLSDVAGFDVHRGILALGERLADPDPRALLSNLAGDGLVVGLFGIANHDNMGGLFRNAAAFGASCLLLDTHCCDPLYRKAIRVSVGAAVTVPFARWGENANPVADLTAAAVRILALSPTANTALSNVAKQRPIAVLFGSEGPGLPKSVLEAAEGVSIAMANGFDSLNVSTTCGIVLHHFSTP